MSNELSHKYLGVEKKLKDKLQELIDMGNDPNLSEKLLQMDLMIRMLNLDQELRPSTQEMLEHLSLWSADKRLQFILEIRKKFDVLDQKFATKITKGFEHQKVQLETPILENLEVKLDSEPTVVKDDCISKLDTTHAQEFQRGYAENSVLDLLRAIRNKVIIFFQFFHFNFLHQISSLHF